MDDVTGRDDVDAAVIRPALRWQEDGAPQPEKGRRSSRDINTVRITSGGAMSKRAGDSTVVPRLPPPPAPYGSGCRTPARPRRSASLTSASREPSYERLTFSSSATTSPTHSPGQGGARRVCDVCVRMRFARLSQGPPRFCTSYCPHCRLCFCADCGQAHARRLTDHVMVDAGRPLAARNYCTSHPDEVLRFHCAQCALRLCLLCAHSHSEQHPLQEAPDPKALQQDICALYKQVQQVQESTQQQSAVFSALYCQFHEAMADCEEQIVAWRRAVLREIQQVESRVVDSLQIAVKVMDDALCNAESDLLRASKLLGVDTSDVAEIVRETYTTGRRDLDAVLANHAASVHTWVEHLGRLTADRAEQLEDERMRLRELLEAGFQPTRARLQIQLNENESALAQTRSLLKQTDENTEEAGSDNRENVVEYTKVIDILKSRTVSTSDASSTNMRVVLLQQAEQPTFNNLSLHVVDFDPTPDKKYLPAHNGMTPIINCDVQHKIVTSIDLKKIQQRSGMFKKAVFKTEDVLRHVTWTPGGHILACVTNSLLVLDRQGALLRSLPCDSPRTVAVFDGTIYVAQRHRQELCMFDLQTLKPAGSLELGWSCRWPSLAAAEDGLFACHSHAGCGEDHLYVRRRGEAAFTPRHLARPLDTPGLYSPHYMAVHPDQGLFVFSDLTKNNGFHLYDRQGAPCGSYTGVVARGVLPLDPTGCAVNPASREVLVADWNNHTVSVLTPGGEYVGQVLGEQQGLEKPRAMATDPAGRLLIGQNDGVIHVTEYWTEQKS